MHKFQLSVMNSKWRQKIFFWNSSHTRCSSCFSFYFILCSLFIYLLLLLFMVISRLWHSPMSKFISSTNKLTYLYQKHRSKSKIFWLRQRVIRFIYLLFIIRELNIETFSNIITPIDYIKLHVYVLFIQ